MLIKNIFFLLIILLTTAAQGQYKSQNGWFVVDEVKGCTGLTINIEFVAGEAPCTCGDSGCACDFFINDTKEDLNSLSYTFTEPGDYTLEVLFPNPNGSDFIDIKIADNTPPEFNIYACSGESILIDISDRNFDNYVVDYDDGTSETVTKGAPNPQHNYPDNTLRTIGVRGLNNNAADNCTTGTEEVIPRMSTPPPAITALTMLDNSTLLLNYDLAQHGYYELQISPANNGNYSFLKKLTPNDTQDTIRNLSLTDNFFCFRLASKDACTNSFTSFSNSLCSIDLAVTVENDVNLITWKTADPDVEFRLKRDDLLTRPFSPSTRSYDDRDIECDVTYCYTLVANYANGYTSTSLQECGTAVSTTPPEMINNISTIVDNSAIAISWEPRPAIATYQVLNTSTGESFTVSQSSFQDAAVKTSEQSACYEINAINECGNETEDHKTVCSIFLTGVSARDNTIKLSWNEYDGWENGVAEYLVEKSYPSGGTSRISTTTNSFTETDDNIDEQVINYRIIAVPNDAGLQRSSSNSIRIIKPANIHYPDAFTPDGNGLNEIFQINGRFITSYQLRIYNRWGELIFVSEDMTEGWDGTTSGKVLPQGTYAFISDMQDMAGRKYSKTGTILLLRR